MGKGLVRRVVIYALVSEEKVDRIVSGLEMIARGRKKTYVHARAASWLPYSARGYDCGRKRDGEEP